MGKSRKGEELRPPRHTDQPVKRKLGSLLEFGEDDLERELAELEQREKETKDQIHRLEEAAAESQNEYR